MIRTILFVLFAILISVFTVIATFFGTRRVRERDIYKSDKKHIAQKYEDQIKWSTTEEVKKQILQKRDEELAEFDKTHPTNTDKYKKLSLIGIIGWAVSCALVILIPGSFHQVNTGEVAVVRELGKIVEIRQPGTYFDFYMTKKYENYDTKVQQDKILTAAYSKDGQTMELEVFLQYQVQPENIMKIATEYGGLDALQSRIETVAIEKTKAVMSSDIAMNIIQNRAVFSNDVSTAVREGISEDYYVNVKDVVLTNIDFTDEFEKSVESKVIAEQDKVAAITKAEAELEVAKREAEKKITEANGDAQAQLIIAQAAGKAATAKFAELATSLGYTVEETESGYVIDTTTGPGTAQFKTLVEDYLNYLAYLSTWDGHLPQVVSGDDAISIIVPNS